MLCLTPTLTGALVTLFSKSKTKKSKVVRGTVLGSVTGLLLSLTITIAFAVLALNMTVEDITMLEDELLQFIFITSAATTAISGVLTSLVLGIRSLFSSS